MLVVVLSLLLCACANGLAVEAGQSISSPFKEGTAHLPAGHAPLVYRDQPGFGRSLFNPVAMNWTEASKLCRLYKGHLAFPNRRADAQVMWNIMKEYNMKQIHLGFHDQFIERDYYTALGKKIAGSYLFNEWTSEVPVGSTNKNCGGLRQDGLVDMNCEDSYPSICQEEETSGDGGLAGYENIDGHGYYKHYDLHVTWPEAFKTCYDEGAHLWIINSAAEKTAVFGRYKITDESTDIWVGTHHLYADRYFVTIFDEPLEKTGYSTWAPGEPKGSQSLYPYVCVRLAGFRIQKNPYNFVCEYNPLQ